MARLWRFVCRVSGLTASAVVAVVATWVSNLGQQAFFYWWYNTNPTNGDHIATVNYWLSAWTLFADLTVLLATREIARWDRRMLTAQKATMDGLAAHMEAVDQLLRRDDGTLRHVQGELRGLRSQIDLLHAEVTGRRGHRT